MASLYSLTFITESVQNAMLEKAEQIYLDWKNSLCKRRSKLLWNIAISFKQDFKNNIHGKKNETVVAVCLVTPSDNDMRWWPLSQIARKGACSPEDLQSTHQSTCHVIREYKNPGDRPILGQWPLQHSKEQQDTSIIIPLHHSSVLLDWPSSYNFGEYLFI